MCVVCVWAKDGLEHQANDVAGAGCELWLHYVTSEPAAGVAAASSLSHLQSLLQARLV